MKNQKATSSFLENTTDPRITYPAFRKWYTTNGSDRDFNGGVVVFDAPTRCMVLYAPCGSPWKVGQTINNCTHIEISDWKIVSGVIQMTID